MINPEILALLRKQYEEMPQDAESVPLKDVPLLEAFHLFKNNEPDIVIFKFTDEENVIYIGSNKKKSEE